MITFIEHEHTGYPLRTRDNAMLTDGTLAFAVNWKSSGMLLTKKCCYNKPFIKIDISQYGDFTDEMARDIARQLEEKNIRHLNIAGNSFVNLAAYYTQAALDAKVKYVMNKVCEYWKLESVTTGGQTGVDEAGAKWADGYGLPVTVRAPKGWMFRQGNRDICSEHLFIKRFGDKYDMSDIL